MRTCRDIFSEHGVEPTIVFDTYWQFAVERQAVFFRRFHQHPPPWTSDPIIAQHKFTNAYRAADRTSQYLIRNVITSGDRCLEEIFFRILLFKFFNQISTWELLQKELGTISYAEFSVDTYDRILQQAKRNKQRIYSAAYIMPSGTSAFGSPHKHRNHLELLSRMMRAHVPQKIAEARSMQAAYDTLLAYPMIGPFLAYQYVTDINYSDITRYEEDTFVVPGPGARDGIHKCFRSIGRLSEADVIKMVQEKQEEAFERMGLQFQTLWGRRLQFIDCQNLFCEISKYARIKHPDIVGTSGRTRIKQQFRATRQPIDYVFPEKWGINEHIAQSSSTRLMEMPSHAPQAPSRPQPPEQQQLSFIF